MGRDFDEYEEDYEQPDEGQPPDEQSAVALHDPADEDAALWRDMNGTIWGDLLLPFDVTVPPVDVHDRPLILDLAHASKRHLLIFLFFARPIFVTGEGAKMQGQRYFHRHEVMGPRSGAKLNLDRLFVYAHSLMDHLQRVRSICWPRTGAEEARISGASARQEAAPSPYPASYWHLSWQAQRALEASARDVERVLGGLVATKQQDWGCHAEVVGTSRVIRPSSLENNTWERTKRIPFDYPLVLLDLVDRLRPVALTELEHQAADREAEEDPDLQRSAVTASAGAGATSDRDLPVTADKATADRAINTASHSDDFRFVSWYGSTYTFTPQQSAVVSLLWAQFEKHPDLGLSEATIAETLAPDVERFRLSHLFRRKNTESLQIEGRTQAYIPHPAWGTMIHSPAKGTYCLRVRNPR